MLTEIGLEEMKDEVTDVYRHIKLPSHSQSTPPIVSVEFSRESIKYKVTGKTTRDALLGLPASSKFSGVAIAPDKTYRERCDHKVLTSKAAEKNLELQQLGTVTHKWIVRKMRLAKIPLAQGDGET